MEDLRVLFFLHIIQTFLMTTVGLRLFDYRVSLKSLIFIGTVSGVGVWLVRGLYLYYHIPFGTHTLIMMLIILLLLKKIVKASWSIALGTVLVSFSLVMLGSTLSGAVIQFLQIDAQDVLNNPWLQILMGYIESIFLVLMLVINSVYGFTLIKHLSIRE